MFQLKINLKLAITTLDWLKQFILHRCSLVKMTPCSDYSACLTRTVWHDYIRETREFLLHITVVHFSLGRFYLAQTLSLGWCSVQSTLWERWPNILGGSDYTQNKQFRNLFTAHSFKYLLSPSLWVSFHSFIKWRLSLTDVWWFGQAGCGYLLGSILDSVWHNTNSH